MKRKHALLLSGLLLLLCAFLCVPGDCAFEGYGHVFAKNRDRIKKVALTFDDGLHPRYTPKILEILDEYHITATFFVIGTNVEYYPEALEAVAEAGCEIGNHTYSHTNLKNKSDSEIAEELQKCEEAIQKVTGQKPALIRPPEGAYRENLQKTARDMKYQIILWSIDTMDWAHNPADRIVSEALDSLCDGDIILMHDYTSGKNTTCDALRILIPAIQSRGFEFVTVSELIKGDAD